MLFIFLLMEPTKENVPLLLCPFYMLVRVLVKHDNLPKKEFSLFKVLSFMSSGWRQSDGQGTIIVEKKLLYKSRQQLSRSSNATSEVSGGAEQKCKCNETSLLTTNTAGKKIPSLADHVVPNRII